MRRIIGFHGSCVAAKSILCTPAAVGLPSPHVCGLQPQSVLSHTANIATSRFCSTSASVPNPPPGSSEKPTEGEAQTASPAMEAAAPRTEELSEEDLAKRKEEVIKEAEKLMSGEEDGDSDLPEFVYDRNNIEQLDPRELSKEAAAASSSSSAIKTRDADQDSLKEIDEPMRWHQEYKEKDFNKDIMLDAKGEYIVSAQNWPTGELAYQTPPEPGKLAHRFGYNVISVKKSETYWQYYRKNPHFSVRYLFIQVGFLVLLAKLTAWLSVEYRDEVAKFQKPAGMVGEALGRGLPNEGRQKVAFEKEEVNEIMEEAQEFYLSGKENQFVGSKDYQMKKIKRPKEFDVKDFMRKENVRDTTVASQV